MKFKDTLYHIFYISVWGGGESVGDFRRKIRKTCKSNVLHKPAKMESEEESKPACASVCYSWTEERKGFTVAGFSYNTATKNCACNADDAEVEDATDDDERCVF